MNEGVIVSSRATAAADAEGLEALYLLTTTVESYFPSFGFERIQRDDLQDSPDFGRRLGRRSIIGVGVLGTALVDESSTLHTARGRFAYWGLLAIAVVVMLGQIVTSR